jgi:hypothetical protein
MFRTVVDSVQSAANSVAQFANRHRRKFIVLGVVGGTTYLLLRLARSKLQQVQQTMQNEQKLAINKKKYAFKREPHCTLVVNEPMTSREITSHSHLVTMQDASLFSVCTAKL